MRRTTAFVVLSTVALLISISVSSEFSNKNRDAGALWSVNLGLGGEDLRIFESGRYESRVWGDLPPYELVKGNWRQQGDLLYLVPDMPREPVRTFKKIERFGCTYLRRPGMKVPLDLFPSGITHADFSIKGSGCGAKAREKNEVGRAQGMRPNNSFKPTPLRGAA